MLAHVVGEASRQPDVALHRTIDAHCSPSPRCPRITCRPPPEHIKLVPEGPELRLPTAHVANELPDLRWRARPTTAWSPLPPPIGSEAGAMPQPATGILRSGDPRPTRKYPSSGKVSTD